MLIKKVRLLLFFCLFVTSESQATLHKEDLQTISKFFCPEDPLFSRTLLGGISNSPLYVFTKKNEEEIPFGVFKYETKSEEFAIARLMLLEEIKNQGFQNLPKIIKNINGEYLTKINGKNYSCLEYLIPDPPGEEISFSSMLELIGRFHAASIDLPNAPIITDRMLEHFKKRKHFFLDPQLKKADPSLFNTPIWEKIISLSDFYTTPEFEKIYNALPAQIVHGDIHSGNIVKSKGTLYLIDFDLMRYDIRLWDLACCISFNFFDDFIKKVKNENFNSFIESYYELKGINLEDFEKEHLCEIITFRELDVISWFLEMMHQGILHQNEAQFNKFRQYLLKHLVHIEQLQCITSEGD
jgi:Ser/Thr protein kinase RdoA (MazF antagonist)